MKFISLFHLIKSVIFLFVLLQDSDRKTDVSRVFLHPRLWFLLLLVAVVTSTVFAPSVYGDVCKMFVTMNGSYYDFDFLCCNF